MRVSLYSPRSVLLAISTRVTSLYVKSRLIAKVSTPRRCPLGKIRHGHAIIFHRLRVIGSVIVDFGKNTALKTLTHRAERRRH